MYKLLEDDNAKMIVSESYNSFFNRETGFFCRMGKTPEDDPEWCPFGPEIADIEISTICHNGCKFCYKSNTRKGKYMTLSTFIKVFSKLPKTINQIAFGIGDVDSNPDLYKIMKYCRANGVVPNITINGKRMTDRDYDNLASLCGAVSVSYYDDKTCAEAILNLHKRGLKQVNVHCLLSEETYYKCIKAARGELSPYMNAVIFLWLKPRGEHNTYHQISKKHYKEILKVALEHKTKFGFDSCSAPFVLQEMPEQKEYIEPCESTLFSIYINVDGVAFPCSFSEDGEGVNVIPAGDFNDVWLSEKFMKFRGELMKNKDENGCRNCLVYKLEFGGE